MSVSVFVCVSVYVCVCVFVCVSECITHSHHNSPHVMLTAPFIYGTVVVQCEIKTLLFFI